MNVEPSTLNLLQSALWYASLGWQVFPLRSRSKHPFKNFSWPAKASSDPQDILFWWKRVPDANIGLHPGPSGLVVMDLDSYKRGGVDLGLAEVQTPTTLTGGGGEHLFYQMPAGKRYGSARRGLPENIDIRGYGGYVILPPSIHPGGGRYEWEEGYSPADVAPAKLPAEIDVILDNANAHWVEPAEFGRAVPAPELDMLRLPDDIRYYIEKGHPAGWDRSRLDHTVVFHLIRLGCSNEQVEAIFGQFPIGERYLEKNGHGERYLGYSVAKARDYMAQEQQPYVPWLDRVPGARCRNARTELEMVEDALGYIPPYDLREQRLVIGVMNHVFTYRQYAPVLHRWLGDRIVPRDIEPTGLDLLYKEATGRGWDEEKAIKRIAQRRLFGELV